LVKSSSYQYHKKIPTPDIVKSLAKGQEEPLIVKANGIIMQGNTRIKILEERGYDINSLERTLYGL